VDDILERFERAMDSMAGIGRYPFDRREAWLERLRINLPELAAFERLRPETEIGLLGPPASIVQPGGEPVADDADGAAAIARDCRARPEQAAAPALAALEFARRNAHLNAFISLADAAAIEAAATWARGALRDGAPMPLMGVPVAVKDLMQVAGLPQTNGSGGPEPATADRDALAVARLREAGAIFVGMANLHELAYGITSRNPHYGAVVNPRHPDRTPGGSSGGSAAAVAAGIVRLAIGTDTAGSIRLPAACCGVVGFKPSFDAIPRDGSQALGTSLDHLGPITANVADAALMFSVMAGQPARTARRLPLAGLRIGVPTRHFFDPVAPDVDRAVRAALERMREDGARLVPVELPGIESAAALQLMSLCAEATDLHWARLVERPETLGPDVRVRLEIGQFLPATWYTRAQRGRAALAAMFATTMQQVDVLVTPTLRVEPPRQGAASARIDGRDIPLHTALTSLTMPFNLTGMPALTLPCGRGDEGLPIGIQIAGHNGDDWRVLDTGARLEDLLDQAN